MAAPSKKSASGGKAQRVTAALVQVEMGGRSVQFSRGDVLPEGVSEDSLKHLDSLGYVEEVDAPAESDSK